MAHSLGSVLSYDILCNQPDLYSALNVKPLSSPSKNRQSSAPVELLLSATCSICNQVERVWLCILQSMQQNKRLSTICKQKCKYVARGPIDALPSESFIKVFQAFEDKKSYIASTP